MKKIVDSRSKVKNIFKPWYQKVRYSNQDKKIIFIFGCQRSGTTMLSYLFDKLSYTEVFGEYSPLSNKDKYKLRFNPLNEVKQIIENSSAPLVICKPLVESQRALEILDYFNNSSAIWIYRNYKDVARSNLIKFGPDRGGRNNIRPICDIEYAKNTWTSWQKENISEDSKNLIKKYYDPNMNAADAAVLFWYLRNDHFFTQNLAEHHRVTLLNYDRFVQRPKATLDNVFQQMNIPYSLPANLFSVISTDSVNKGKSLELTPEIAHLADQMQRQLDQNLKD